MPTNPHEALSGNGAPEASVFAYGSQTYTDTSTGITWTRPAQYAPGTNGWNPLTKTGPIVGVVDASNASAGQVGEFSNVVVTSTGAVNLANLTSVNIAQLALSAGDWDVEGLINFNLTAATVTLIEGGISITSGNLPNDGFAAFSGVRGTTITVVDSITIPRTRVNVASATIIYLTAEVVFSAGTISGFGNMSARRVR